MYEVTCTITTRGRVTIPKPVRDALGVEPGGRVMFVAHDSGQVDLRKPRYTLKELCGIVPAIPGRETEDFDDFIDEAMQDWADREMKIVRGEQPDED